MKLVREHINEKFTEESDPIEDMRIGNPGPKMFRKAMQSDAAEVLKIIREVLGDKTILVDTSDADLHAYTYCYGRDIKPNTYYNPSNIIATPEEIKILKGKFPKVFENITQCVDRNGVYFEVFWLNYFTDIMKKCVFERTKYDRKFACNFQWSGKKIICNGAVITLDFDTTVSEIIDACLENIEQQVTKIYTYYMKKEQKKK